MRETKMAYFSFRSQIYLLSFTYLIPSHYQLKSCHKIFGAKDMSLTLSNFFLWIFLRADFFFVYWTTTFNTFLSNDESISNDFFFQIQLNCTWTHFTFTLPHFYSSWEYFFASLIFFISGSFFSKTSLINHTFYKKESRHFWMNTYFQLPFLSFRHFLKNPSHFTFTSHRSTHFTLSFTISKVSAIIIRTSSFCSNNATGQWTFSSYLDFPSKKIKRFGTACPSIKRIIIMISPFFLQTLNHPVYLYLSSHSSHKKLNPNSLLQLFFVCVISFLLFTPFVRPT